jgi:hypothetical protein
MSGLHDSWRNSGQAKIAFAGYGGGAKFAGWLAAMFASQNSRIAGVYEAGIEDETLINAAMQFQVLTNDAFLEVPIYFHGGARDGTATVGRLRDVADKLHSAGFKNVGVGVLAGAMPGNDPAALHPALDWFRARADGRGRSRP